MAAKAEDDMTEAERIAFLRARGVQVHIPADRQKQPDLACTGPSFTYVRIPLDEREPCEERVAQQGPGDVLPTALAAAFAGDDNLPDEALEAHAKAAGQACGVASLRKVLAQGGAETFRLAVPTDGNGREGVYAYLDESGALKGLPENPRACKLVRQCGFPASARLSGDIFVGRVKWDAAGLQTNLDFSLKDLEDSCLWIRRAPTENSQFQLETQTDAFQAAQEDAPQGPAAGKGDGYSWSDGGDEVEIVLTLPAGTVKKEIKIAFKKSEVVVSSPISFTAKLFAPVDPDGCNWSLDAGSAVLTLEKAEAAPWPQLLAGMAL